MSPTQKSPFFPFRFPEHNDVVHDSIHRNDDFCHGARFASGLVPGGYVLAQTILIFPDHPYPLPRIPIRPSPTPAPAVTYCIKELDIEARIRNQIADVQVTQTFVNKSSATVQAQFIFPLPYDGAIDRLTLMVDGKELSALSSAKRSSKTLRSDRTREPRPRPPRVDGTRHVPNKRFSIPAGAERKVVIHYDQLLRKSVS